MWIDGFFLLEFLGCTVEVWIFGSIENGVGLNGLIWTLKILDTAGFCIWSIDWYVC